MVLWLSGRALDLWAAPNRSFRLGCLRNAICLTQWVQDLNTRPFLRRLKKWERRNKLLPNIKLRLHLFNLSRSCPTYSLCSWRTRGIHKICSQNDVSFMFTVETLHNFHLKISRLLKSCFLNYLPSGYLLTRPGHSICFWKPFSSLKTDILCASNALPASMEETFSRTRIRDDFSKIEALSQVNQLIIDDGPYGSLEEKITNELM